MATTITKEASGNVILSQNGVSHSIPSFAKISTKLQPQYISIYFEQRDFIIDFEDVTEPVTANRDALFALLSSEYFFSRSNSDEGSAVQIDILKGTVPGTLFGDDFSTTHRQPTFAAKWCEGLPIGGAIVGDSTGAGWEVRPDATNPTLFDGASNVYLKAGAAPDKVWFPRAGQYNRYIPGQLSFFGGTGSWDISQANGDFVALFGAFQSGPKSQGLENEVKECVAFGYKRELGVTSFIVRLVKNFEVVFDDEINPDFSTEALNIFELKIGYYGIHPIILERVVKHSDPPKRETIYKKWFDQDTTSVANPNLALGVYMKNNGNTGYIGFGNASFSQGNYQSNPIVNDPTGRDISHVFNADSIAVSTVGFGGRYAIIGAYTVPDVLNMVSKIEDSVITFSDFNSTIANRLNNLIVDGSANKPIYVNIHLLSKEAVTLGAGIEYEQLRPGYNALAFVDGTVGGNILSIDFSQEIDAPIIRRVTAASNIYKLSDEGQDLTSNYVAVIVLTSANNLTVSDFSMQVVTTDLF